MGKISLTIKGALLALFICMTSSHAMAINSDEPIINVAMLHLELKYADLEHNAELIESGIELAALKGADWIMTPELSHTGYRFDLKIGTDWISIGPDKYVKHIQALAKKHKVTVFLSHLEKEQSKSNKAYPYRIFNTLFVINESGEIIGRHKKVNTIPVAESWSAAGTSATVVNVDQQKVGLLICADAWPTTHVQSLKDQGANIILSSASWAPGEYGPGETWENRSKESELPIFVNNRTGIEREFDLTESVSAVSYKGERLMSHKSPNSQLVLIKWDTKNNRLLNAAAYSISK